MVQHQHQLQHSQMEVAQHIEKLEDNTCWSGVQGVLVVDHSDMLTECWEKFFLCGRADHGAVFFVDNTGGRNN